MREIHVSGGCLCGAIRYRIDGRELGSGACHCRDCQYVSGGAPAYILVIEKSSFSLTQGQPTAFESTADSGNKRKRHFCATCGTPLFAEDSAFPEVMTIKAGSLDDPSIFHVAAEFWTQSAPKWHLMTPAAPAFEKGPQRS
ncbi:MAG: GFA family protein [Hyphomicrobiaceae bacterium]